MSTEASGGGTKRKSSPFPSTFYVACSMEIFERMAWYGFFALSSLYITSPLAQGGLGFNSIQRGILQGTIPFLLYLFPVITGALADRYGYRNTFLVAFAILTPGYWLLGQFHSFWGFFFAFLLVAMGAATFKPVVVGTVGRVTDDTNRGLGFGIFYMIVNVGGFIGPVVAGAMRAISWNMVFVASAIWIAFNFIPTIFFYKEPTTESKSETKRSLRKVLTDAQDVLGNGRFALTAVPVLILLMVAGGEWMSWGKALFWSLLWVGVNLLWNLAASKEEDAPWYRKKAKIGNWPFVLYLLILSGFWASFNQIFITMPEYIRDFVDTADLLRFFSLFGDRFVHFIAAVNIDQLSGAIGTLVAKYGAVSDPQVVREIFLEIVNYKVRVPAEVIAAEFARLSAMGTPDAATLTALAHEWADKYRQVNPEYIVNIDAGSIVIFQVLVSWIIQRWSPFPVLVVGTIVAGIGIAMGSIALAGYSVVIAIVVFAFGEMIASPKSQEYVARIAPRDKVALFMGYYFVSIALGNLFGGILSGWGYQKLALGQNKPELMWILFGCVGFLTAAALVAFNKGVVPRLEAQRVANQD
ncbi:MAG TPA: MFS transporter [Bacteroidetes bacterium]|nr:MFS transporter [Bacteroidota bacterium]